MSIVIQKTATEARILDTSVRNPHIIMGVVRNIQSGNITAEVMLEVPSAANKPRTLGYPEGLAMVQTPIEPVPFVDYLLSSRPTLSRNLQKELKAMSSFSRLYQTTGRDSGFSRE